MSYIIYMSNNNEQNNNNVYPAEWDPSSAFSRGNHFMLSILGPSESGKSYLMRDIFIKGKFAGLFDIFIVFSHSLDNAIEADFFANFVPGGLHFKEYKPEVMTKLFEIQERYMANKRRYLNILIIFDDCVSVKQKYSDEILQTFIRGRNKGMSIIFASQAPQLMNSIWRTNSHYVILTRELSFINRQSNIKSFLTPFCPPGCKNNAQKMLALDELYTELTMPPHQVMVIVKKGQYPILYTYIADAQPPPVPIQSVMKKA